MHVAAAQAAASATARTVRSVAAAAVTAAAAPLRLVVGCVVAAPSVVRVQRLVHRFVVHAATVVVVLAGDTRCTKAHVVCAASVGGEDQVRFC